MSFQFSTKFCYKIVFLAVILCLSPSYANFRIKPRIYGGSLAPPQKFPFMISLRARVNYDIYEHICGGSIITPKFILTAAHCGKKRNFDVTAFRVYVDAANNFDGIPHSVKRFIPHPEFKLADLLNDLLFIEVEKPIKFSYTVQPIEIYNGIFSDGIRVSTAGWGSSNVNKLHIFLYIF